MPATSRRLEGQTKKATDVLDIPALNNMAHERTGYPTQKPLAIQEVPTFAPASMALPGVPRSMTRNTLPSASVFRYGRRAARGGGS